MNEKLKLARMQAAAALERDNREDVIQKIYEEACEKLDEETAAEYARKLRNRLLAASDEKMALDKMLPPAPTGTTFTAWLQWLRDLAHAASNAWATYRKNLRDLPTQPGFPFRIEWPQKPED